MHWFERLTAYSVALWDKTTHTWCSHQHITCTVSGGVQEDSLPLHIDATGFEHVVVVCTIHAGQRAKQYRQQGRAGQGRAGQGRARQGKARHCRIGHVRACQGRAGQRAE